MPGTSRASALVCPLGVQCPTGTCDRRPASLPARGALVSTLKQRASSPGPPGTGASWRRSPRRPPAAAHQFPEPTMHTFRGAAAMAKPDRCCTLCFPGPSRIVAASRIAACTRSASQANCSLPLDRPSVAAAGDPAPPSSPPMATATLPGRLGPQLTAGRTRPTTPKNHCARLVQPGGLVSLPCRPTPARGMLGCVVHLPVGSGTVVLGAPRAGRSHRAKTPARSSRCCVALPERSRTDPACRCVTYSLSVQGELSLNGGQPREAKSLTLSSLRFGLGACTCFNSGCQIHINRTERGTP